MTRKIRADANLGQTPIIAVTAHAMSGDEDKALQVGCNDYIAKPIDEDELWEKVEKHIA